MSTVAEMIEEACNEFIVNGGTPTRVKLHPNTLERLMEEVKPYMRVRVQLPYPGTDPVVHSCSYATPAGMVYFDADHTVPIDTAVVE